MIRDLLPIFMLFLVPGILRGQFDAPTNPGADVLTLLGRDKRPSSPSERESSPSSSLLFSLDQETAYDDNVLSNNADRRSDVTYGFTPRLDLREDGKRLSLTLNYEPGVTLYQKTRGYNTLNQGFQLNARYKVAPHFSLRLRDSTIYMNGIIQPRFERPFTPEMGQPSSLNNTVFTSLTRQFENSVRLDAIYQRSRRTFVTIFGGLEERHSGRNSTVGQNLFQMHGEDSGVEYAYRPGRNTALGLIYVFQKFSFGEPSRGVVHSALFSLAQQLTPGLTVEVFGGPQYSRQHERFALVLPPFMLEFRVFRAQWRGSFGGVLSKQVGRTIFQLAAQRMVTEGGGLLTFTTNSYLSAGVQRRLGHRWNAALTLESARTQALGLLFSGDRIESERAGISLDHFFSASLVGRLSYNFLRQRTTGPAPLFANLDRDRVALGLYYQFPRMGWGR